MLVVICLNAQIVLNPPKELNQLGRYTIRQVCGDMIKDARPKVPDPDEDFEIPDG
jgi:hypothetical protein